MLPEIQVPVSSKSLTLLHVFFCLAILNKVLVCGCGITMIPGVVEENYG